MKIGYARVSTVGQDYETQREKLEEYGCEKIFVEKATGTSTTQRKELQAAISHARQGDILVVTKIDRLARSIIDLNNLVQELKDKGVSVHFIGEGIEFDADEKADSFKSLFFNMLGGIAQFERDLIVQRTSEGRERARKQGKHLGRPAQPKKNVERAIKLYEERKTNGMSVNDILKATGIPKSTLYAEIKKTAISE